MLYFFVFNRIPCRSYPAAARGSVFRRNPFRHDGPISLTGFCASLLSGVAISLAGCGGGGGGPDAGTAPLTASTGNDPTIAIPPQSQTVQIGDAVTFSVSASGTAPLTYQWYRNGIALPGSTATSFTLDQAAHLNDQDRYSVRVSNAANANGVTSDAGGLTVTPGDGIDLVAGCATLINRVVSIDGKGSAATFRFPTKLASDKNGTIYVTDGFGIRKISSDGSVTTPFSLKTLGPIAVDGAGNIYVSGDVTTANSGIQKISPERVVSTLLTGTTASGLAVDTMGNVYASDNGNSIRKITPSGTVTTLAGAAEQPGSADGLGTAARFFGPRGLTIDATGNIYVVDAGNQTIRKITPEGIVTTVAGTVGVWGTADGQGTAAQLLGPEDVVSDHRGNIYIVEADGVRKLSQDGRVTRLAGKAAGLGYADGTASAALFYRPEGIAIDAAGNLFVADRQNHVIRRVNADGVVSTLAGHEPGTTYAACAGSTDGDGFTARFNSPGGIAKDAAGNLYIADSGNYTIRKITPTGAVSTVAGMAGMQGSADGDGTNARFNAPRGMAFDAAGNLYVADGVIRKITSQGQVTTLPSPPGIVEITSLSFDGAGNLYVGGGTDYFTGTALLRDSIYKKVAVDGTVATLAESASILVASTDRAGNVFVVKKITVGGSTFCRAAGCVCLDCTIYYKLGKYAADGSFVELGEVPEAPRALAIDDAGNAYVSGQYAIYKVTPAGVVTTLAGHALDYSVGTRLGPLPGSLFSPTAMTALTSGGVSRLIVTDLHAIVSISLGQ